MSSPPPSTYFLIIVRYHYEQSFDGNDRVQQFFIKRLRTEKHFLIRWSVLFIILHTFTRDIMSDSRKADEYFQIRKTIQKLIYFMGVWPDDDSGPLYRILPCLPIALYLNAVMIIFNSIAHHLDNGKIVTLSIGVIAVYLLCALKVDDVIIDFFLVK